MLVLTRKLNDTVTITTPGGYTIVVKVTDLFEQEGRKKVKLGFEAPPEVEIVRYEARDKGPRRAGDRPAT